jgi:hypothetical protein
MQLDEENLKGASLDKLNLKQIETRIKKNRFVKDAQLYSDLKGNLVVKATLAQTSCPPCPQRWSGWLHRRRRNGNAGIG